MPVNTTGSTVQYTGDAEQTTFPFTFPIGSEGDLVVKVRVTATGVTVTQTLTTHYTVTKSGTNFDNGGNVEMVSAPAATDTLIITRDTTQTQSTDLIYGDPHDSEAYEDMVDRNTKMIQELQAQVNRCLKVPDTDSESLDMEFANSVDRASQYAGFNGDGEPIAAATFAAYGAASVFAQDFLDDANGAAFWDTLLASANAQVSQEKLELVDAGQQVTAFIKTLMNDTTAAIARATLLSSYADPQNLLINGGMRFWQRLSAFTGATTPANNDDTYLMDRWVQLSDGNDIADIAKETTVVPNYTEAAAKIDIETANKKMGILQVVENKNSLPAIGRYVSLSFEAKKVIGNATVDKLRAAIISWDSTADTVTSDVVSAWGAEGTDPTLVANWTYENTPSDLTLTNSFQTFTIENVPIDTASTTNIAVFIWIDNNDGTVADLVYITNIKLEIGAVATPYLEPDFEIELARCQRYYEKSYNIDVNPGTATSVGDIDFQFTNVANNTFNVRLPVSFAVKKRDTPTVVSYSVVGGNSGKVDMLNEEDAVLTDQGESGFSNSGTAGGASTARAIKFHYTASSEL